MGFPSELQDDPSIPDDEWLYRGIHQNSIAGNRVSSAAFKSRPPSHISVDRASLCKPQETFYRLPKSVAVAQLSARAARGQKPLVVGVASDPTADNPAHALIVRDLSRSNSQWAKTARELARACEWAIHSRP